MKVENTYDELLFAATHGVMADAAEVEALTVPPGREAVEFQTEVMRDLRQIVQLQQQGEAGSARAVATDASAGYVDAFPQPTPIGGARLTDDFDKPDESDLRSIVDTIGR